MSRRRILGLLLALPIMAGLAVVPAEGGQSARVPQGFVGVMLDGPAINGRVDLGAQMSRMVASGVESVRVPFNWANQEPYPNWSHVPRSRVHEFTNTDDGTPADFRFTDQVVANAARRRLRVMPVPLYAPSWDAVSGGTRAQPEDVRPYANYVGALVARYGAHGIFWQEHPRLPYLPVEQWQVWNEPNMDYFWTTQPFAESYVALLQAAHDAIKAQDPDAQIVLAGLSNYSWHSLSEIYAVPGAASLFDAVAVHAYTAQPQGVLKILGYVRGVMHRHGDSGKPLILSEFGWPSSLGRNPQTFGIATTRAQQARDLAAVIPRLAAARTRLHLAGFYLYTWLGDETPGSSTFDYSGLLAYTAAHRRITAKPALDVFTRDALSLEHCRRKSAQAMLCADAG